MANIQGQHVPWLAGGFFFALVFFIGIIVMLNRATHR